MNDHHEKPISASPTKGFFVDMLIRDIPLQQAVLDLIDNCVDGAKRIRQNEDFSGLRVNVDFSKDRFAIVDNCGGFSKETAREYAFRFGREREFKATKHSIGQFGVGMKRALFKMGKEFVVESKTIEDHWAVNVDVDDWEGRENDWTFPWSTTLDERLQDREVGTFIQVSKLREGTASSFETSVFSNRVTSSIKSKHREFISKGLEIFVNGSRVDASDLKLYSTSNLKPVVEKLTISEGGDVPVDVRIVVGLGDPIPKQAGWYVVCNGRVILDADRRPETGWGYVEENADRPNLPSFHNQFSRFRGIVYFDSDDSSRVPWNTMKTDIDEDNIVWQKAFERMVILARHVLDFINQLDREIEDYGREKSPLMKVLKSSPRTSVDNLNTVQAFKAPDRSSVKTAPPLTNILYARPDEDVEFLKKALNVRSAKAVGEKTFDLMLERQRG
ncbi:MAG: ATP-binding protein [Rhodobacteraceae bacterium]|nr:ATP-binding protein [Paracoccaceae bacterium]